VGSGAGRVLPGLLRRKSIARAAWTPVPTAALGRLFRRGMLVKTHPRLLWEDRYLPGPPRRDLGHRGHAVIRIAWPPPWMLCSSRPVRWE
jgi:hypothetical protein